MDINIRHIAIKQVIQLIIEFNQSQLTKLNWSISIPHIMANVSNWFGSISYWVKNWDHILDTRMTRNNKKNQCYVRNQTCLLIKFVDRMKKKCRDEIKWLLGHLKSCTKQHTLSSSPENCSVMCTNKLLNQLKWQAHYEKKQKKYNHTKFRCEVKSSAISFVRVRII